MVLRLFTRPVNPRSFGSWCVKGTEESTSKSGGDFQHHILGNYYQGICVNLLLKKNLGVIYSYS